MRTKSKTLPFSSIPFIWLEQLIVRSGLPVDERRKRTFIMLFLLTALPILAAFALWHGVTTGRFLAASLLTLTIAVGIGVFYVLRYAQHTVLTYRIGVFFILSLLVYLLASGDSFGIAYIWFFFHPVAAFFLFGNREGLFWVVLSWLICFLITVVNLAPYTYPLTVGLRFMVSYTLVSILAYGLESARQYYYDQLTAEKVALEEALQQVKRLQGLLPICASCKKIRDDGGYWHQVESYMSRHAEVEFSHGICPECRTKLYSVDVIWDEANKHSS